jgi:hypothetical protein
MSDRLPPLLTLTILALTASACIGISETLSPPPTVPVEQPATAEVAEPEIESVETQVVQPVEKPRPFSPAAGGNLSADRNDLFATAGTCVSCHQSSFDEAGNDVTNGEYWRSTMMANAAIDPYYLAGVSMNVARYPGYRVEIETKCGTCHMPMAHFSDAATGQPAGLFGAEGYLDPVHPLHTLAVDGVSCTSCHQIQAEGLGDFESFSGGTVFDTQTPMGTRDLFGPYVPHQSGERIMSNGSGFLPMQGDHLQQSELCATCHDLYTHYVTADNTLSEEWFPEQTPYAEWLHSDYATQSSCQDCHMPPAEGAVDIANMGPPITRQPYAKHDFVGGNTYILEVLKNYGGELGVQAAPEHFDATTERALLLLQSQTASLAITNPALTGNMLSFDVTTNALTGHKFPAGYPSRRAWLHVTVKDSTGQVVFESGSVSDDGAVSGNDNDLDGLAFEPHYDEITSPEQVQIYEAIMQDVHGDVTTMLLAASEYAKDNRLLPAGFDKATAPAEIAPQGKAFNDDDFLDGTDTLVYRVDTENTAGPYTVEVELLYQSIAYRWAQELKAFDTEQTRTFSDYYRSIPNLPVVVAEQSAQSQ